MIDLHGVIDIHKAPPLAPAEQAIDLDHLFPHDPGRAQPGA